MFDYQTKKSEVTHVCDQTVFEQMLAMTRVESVAGELAALARELDNASITREDYDARKTRLKGSLPAFCFHAHYPQGRRCSEGAEESGLAIYDVDHIDDPVGYWKEREGRLEKAGVLKWTPLVHVTPSSRGLRLVFVRPLGMTIAQAQAWMAGVLGDTVYDTAVSDLARCSYAVPRSYLLRYDPAVLFAPHPAEAAPYFGEAPVTAPGRSVLKPVDAVVQPSLFGGGTAGDGGEPDCFMGVPYSSIVDEWLRQHGGMPGQGFRHNTMLRLAADLVTITDASPRLVRRLLPECGLPSAEVDGLVKSVCERPFRHLSASMRKVFSALRINPSSPLPPVSASREEEEEAPRKGDADTSWLYSPTPPPLPVRLPSLPKLMVSCTPEEYRATVAQAVFPALAAHLYDTHFRYLDNTLHEATLMNVLMAPTGSGKSCVNKPIEMIMADIKARDKVNLQRENDWRETLNQRRPSDKVPPRPDNLVVQQIDADITHAAFMYRLKEAQGRFLYLKVNEIEQLANLAVGSKGQQHMQIICLAFDHDNEYGQMRAAHDAVQARATLRFNFNASTTVVQGQRFFSRVLTDGPLSRINFCTLPEAAIGSEIPVYGSYDALFADSLRPYVDNLTAAHGEVVCPHAAKLARQLLTEVKTAASLTQDRVLDNFSHRAVVIAWLKACVLYVANGYVWERSFRQFVRWSLRYDLWCKLHFFGAAVRAEMESSPDNSLPSVRPNQIDLLPHTFTVEDVARLPCNNSLTLKQVHGIIRQWVYRKKIRRLDNGKGYEKQT